MKKLVISLLGSLLLSFCIYAAEESSDEETVSQEPVQEQTTVDEQQEPVTEPEADDSLTQGPSDEDFIPTERITEDLPVAFPVDI